MLPKFLQVGMRQPSMLNILNNFFFFLLNTTASRCRVDRHLCFCFCASFVVIYRIFSQILTKRCSKFTWWDGESFYLCYCNIFAKPFYNLSTCTAFFIESHIIIFNTKMKKHHLSWYTNGGGGEITLLENGTPGLLLASWGFLILASSRSSLPIAESP